MRVIRLSQTQTSAVSEHANKIGIIVCSGMRLSLFTETLFGTLYSLRLKKAIHIYNFTLTTSIGTVELRFLNHGCLRLDNIAADCHHNGLMREQFPPLIMATMLWMKATNHEQGS